MVRWKVLLAIAILLVLPSVMSENDEDEEFDGNTDVDSEEEDEDEENEYVTAHRAVALTPVRAIKPSPRMTTLSSSIAVTRTVRKRPLECFACAFKAGSPLRACLDPMKYSVNTVTCHSSGDKCFTWVVSKGNIYEAVIRGCRTDCTSTKDVTCCAGHRCNNQALPLPSPSPKMLMSNKADKTLPTNVFFFVSILLVLQTVIKVTIV